ncbi:hypothetical protein P175DRAFT_0193252 [Aspergillus ochraceoroseus IBT 24754]|uniref:Zn(2)-C6 fungal-type domain-containing protein n=1 Tax=Aspergillus ochraceoroseus IBT 24754 TaxID=1392256 RepID=A0A2T5LZC0_9EURO|nr:uncharacterized protein P175DRAFT_0193252 [Aspergillus ochraceoroseus IBT 24754]PTU21624.1 hypothetical protein P175DRAFT_0193252 [Aspergillus ochraceoroseus IBT 24754]
MTGAREPKACRACAYAKVKCEAQTVEGCKRCLRLKRQCIMQAPGAHKRKPQRPSSDVARLERKIDSMAAFLTASPQSLLAASPAEGSGSRFPGQSPGLSISSWDKQALPSDEEAKELVMSFQAEMAPYFPFVVVPADVSVSELRQTKPFLFRTIGMVASLGDAHRQLELERIVQEYICNSIILRGEKSLDLLQGLLVYLSWYHFQLQSGPQLCSILHLALAMANDIGLNSRPDRRTEMDHTIEERRAHLGCVYMSSVVSLCARNMDPVRYTRYTEECCRVLEDTRDHPTDLYLVRLSRLHRIADRIKRTFCFDEYDASGPALTAPLGMCIKSFETELQQLRQQPLTLKMLHNSIVPIHYCTVELSLYKIALDDDFPTDRYDDYPLIRLNILYSCLTTLKAFFEMFNSIPSGIYLKLPYPIYASYTNALDILSRILLFPGETWDHEYARSVIDFPAATGIITGKVKTAVQDLRLEQPLSRIPDQLAGVLLRVRGLEELHAARHAACVNRSAPSGDARMVSDERTPTVSRSRAVPVQELSFQLPHDLSWRLLNMD